MSMPVPSPENLPLITEQFLRSLKFRMELKTHANSHEPKGGVHSPVHLLPRLADAFNLLDEHISSGILAALKPEFKTAVILYRNELDASAIECREDCRAKLAGASSVPEPTEDQFKMWMLQTASYAKHIDWRKIASLINECSEDQQSAVDEFFCELCGVGIDSLLATKGHEISIPEGLSSNEIRVFSGETEIFCPLAKEWLRDDIFLTQFLVRVEIQTQFTTISSKLVYVGTLDQAIATATAFTLDCSKQAVDGETSYLNDLREQCRESKRTKFYIYLQDYLVSSAGLYKFIQKGSEGKQTFDCKIKWNEKNMGQIPAESFKKSIFSAEKALGVQWNKVRHLESDLGM